MHDYDGGTSSLLRRGHRCITTAEAEIDYGRGANARTHRCTSTAEAQMHLMGVHLTGVQLMGVHLMGVCLMAYTP
jgi:hypothetical protein